MTFRSAVRPWTRRGERLEFVGNRLTARLQKTWHVDLPAADIARAASVLRGTPDMLPALACQSSIPETNLELVACGTEGADK